MTTGLGFGSRFILAIACAAVLAGCAGGSHALVPSAPGVPVDPSGPAGSMRLTISIPVTSTASASPKHPAFVVSATNGLDIKATNASSVIVAETAFDVSASSPSCSTTGGLRSCTLSFAVQTGGPYTFTLTSYDRAPSGGTIPPGANVLAIGVMTNATVVQGVSNAFTATLAGTPSTTAYASSRNVAMSNGTPTSFAIPLGVKDASGTAIVGAFSSPLSASVSETGGHTLLSVDGGTTKSGTVAIQSSTDAANLIEYYDGAGPAGYVATVSASASGVTGASTVVDTFSVTGSVGFGTPLVANRAAKFTAPGQQIVLAPSETHFAGTFGQTQTCGGSVTVSTSGANFHLLSILPTASCHVDISDGTLTFVTPVSVTTTGGSIGIPPPSGTVTTMGSLASGMSPFEIVAGPDGKLWFAANDGSDGELGSVDLGGTLHEYPIAGAASVTVSVGGDGRIWSGDGNDGKVHAIDPSTHAIASYDFTGILGFTGGIAFAPDGNMWVTDGSSCSIDLVDLSGTLVNQVQVPFCGALSDIIEGPDGKMWIGDQVAGQIARVDVASLTVERLPTTMPSGAGRLTVGHDGAVWFTLLYGGGLGRMSVSGAYAFYPTPGSVPEFGVVSAPDNTLIFSSCSCSGGIDRMTTGGQASSIAIGAAAFDFAAGPDGGVWFTDYGNNAIGRLQP